MKREEFSKQVRAEAFLRCGGNCEKCAMKLKRGEAEFDHVIAYFLTQDSTLSNCQVLCTPCHRGAGAKTADDQRIIAKVKRVEAKHNGTFKKAGAFSQRFKRKMNGDVVDARTGEVISR